MSARGRRFTHADAVRFAAGTELTILCGHYKDVDQRVADHLATEELSLGDFVLSGGEPAALAIIDATVRLLPGAMSDLDSARTRFVLRARAERAELHAAAGVSRTRGARRFCCPAITRRSTNGARREGRRLSEERSS